MPIIRLEPSDSHWIRLNDPDNVARDIGEWWENNAREGQARATIDIRIPEVIGVGGKARIRWYSNDWHHIGLSKSKDGKAFSEIWGRSAHYNFDETHEIELDPECKYYRISFSDGNGYTEVTRVHKDIEIVIPATPTPTPKPKQIIMYVGVYAGGAWRPNASVTVDGMVGEPWTRGRKFVVDQYTTYTITASYPSYKTASKSITTANVNFITDVYLEPISTPTPATPVTFITKDEHGAELHGVKVYINKSLKGET